MTQNTTRTPVRADRSNSHALTPSADDSVLTRSNLDDSAAFLENAAGHLRDAGYSVEVDLGEGEVCIYVEGQEVHFVKTPASKPPGQKTLKH